MLPHRCTFNVYSIHKKQLKLSSSINKVDRPKESVSVMSVFGFYGKILCSTKVWMNEWEARKMDKIMAIHFTHTVYTLCSFYSFSHHNIYFMCILYTTTHTSVVWLGLLCCLGWLTHSQSPSSSAIISPLWLKLPCLVTHVSFVCVLMYILLLWFTLSLFPCLSQSQFKDDALVW